MCFLVTAPYRTLPLLRLPSSPLGAASQLVSPPRRAQYLVHFLVAASYRIAPHAAPPPPPLVPARRRVAACESTAPRAISRAFPRRRAISHRTSRCPSSAFLAPARRRVAACESTAPRAISRAFPRRRAIFQCRSRCPSSASQLTQSTIAMDSSFQPVVAEFFAAV
jgi:hypothetical protein